MSSAPVNVRLDSSEEESLKALVQATGLKKSELMRRAARFAFPRFLSGEIPLMTLPVVATGKGKHSRTS